MYKRWYLIAAAQLVSTLILVWHAFSEFPADDSAHILTEMLAVAITLACFFVQFASFREVLARKKTLEAQVTHLSAELLNAIEERFDAWGLSASEREVAHLLIKGGTIQEIAAQRGAAEGTIKAQTNAIYRKSGSKNRSDVVVLLMDAVLHKAEIGGAL